MVTDPVLFWNRVNKECANGCWEWQGAKNGAGYGSVNWGKRVLKTHRLAYELIYGPIPDGLYICHHCDNSSCCNPDHLFAGTSSDNAKDRDRKNRRDFTLWRPKHPENRSGENHHKAKLNDESVRTIIKKHCKDGVPKSHLAREYGVSCDTIRNIITRKNWRHVHVDI